jgi:hypothetical protein
MPGDVAEQAAGSGASAGEAQPNTPGGAEQASFEQDPDVSFYRELKEKGYSREKLSDILTKLAYTHSADGRAKQMREFEQRHGDEIGQRWFAGIAASSEGRRKLRRILEVQQPEGQPDGEQAGYGSEGAGEEMPSWARRLMTEFDAVKSQVTTAGNTANEARNLTTGALTALERSALIDKFARKNAAAANDPESFVEEVNGLIEGDPERYAGPVGVDRAGSAVLARWARHAKALGHEPKPQLPQNGGGGGGGIPTASQAAKDTELDAAFKARDFKLVARLLKPSWERTATQE